MPCGGIYPLSNNNVFSHYHDITNKAHNCFLCDKIVNQEDLMFCDEWDCYLHRACVIPFLETEEGKIVLSHGHCVVLYNEKE